MDPPLGRSAHRPWDEMGRSAKDAHGGSLPLLLPRGAGKLAKGQRKRDFQGSHEGQLELLLATSVSVTFLKMFKIILGVE